MKAKGAWRGHGTLMVPVKQGKKRALFSAVAPQRGSAGGHGRTEQTHSRSRHTKAAVMGAEMAAVPQAISSGGGGGGDDPQR